MDKIISIALAVALGLGGFYFFKVKNDLESQIETLRINDEISINSSVLAEVTQFTFSKIKTDFTYVHKKSGLTPLPWKGIYEYQWEFEYHFGIDVPQGWKWNFRDSSDGSVSIDVPPLTQLNDFNIKVNLIDRIEPANGPHSAEMKTETDAVALQRVKDVQAQYLRNPTVIETTRRSLESFFLNLLNERSEGSPVHKVTINFKA